MTSCDKSADQRQDLKVDLMSRWIEQSWMPERTEQDLITLWVAISCVHETALSKFDPSYALPEGFRFVGSSPVPSSVVTRITWLYYADDLTYRSGANVYRFVKQETGETVEVLVVSSYYSDEGDIVALACLPRSFIPVWKVFAEECDRLAGALTPNEKVVIIGGRTGSFVPTVKWDEIVLPVRLKEELLEDVDSFFTKGIEVYRRLNLKPFRKLLLAGVPGTGKTMLCSALAKWALDREYVVIYVSSADRMGSSFMKIQHALSVAANSNRPALLLLEELDAYLDEEEKALVLNVLDGSESSVNDKGTLLIATTNYPEAIDERVLKRPGRLDRVFIIPETRDRDDAELMLRRYLGDMWRDEHRALVRHLVGYPGAFIREVAVYALTQVAHDDLPELPLEMLERSFQGLKDQIEARDDFLTRRSHSKMGFGVDGNGFGRRLDALD
jgi:hypothetical protein